VLYGDEALIRIETCTGGTTAHLRKRWGLSGILGGEGKNRADHRHHAVDAMVVGLTSRSAVKRLSDAAARAEELRLDRLTAEVLLPWPEFPEEARLALSGVVASHRVRKRARGALHEDTTYGRPRREGGGVVARKALDKLQDTPRAVNAVSRIIDPAVRAAVAGAAGGNPKKAFRDPEQLPLLGKHPIRRARVELARQPVAVGTGAGERLVMPGNNHHVEIFAFEERGKTIWKGRMVTMLEACRRRIAGVPLVDRVWEEGVFVFSLAGGEVLEVEYGELRELVFLRSISAERTGIFLYGALLNDARPFTSISPKSKENGFFKYSLRQLGEVKARKVALSPLGHVRSAND